MKAPAIHIPAGKVVPVPRKPKAQDVHLEVLGRTLKVHTLEYGDSLTRAKEVLESGFHDMEEAYEVTWGSSPSALDSTTWLLMGALNLAHRVAQLEQEATRTTQDLEHTLSKLLDDVPDESHDSHPQPSTPPGAQDGLFGSEP
ncbi:MAG: cell division protein ZapA [Holophagaceae bacterium]|nr:cell division protein ZapA [Holophagaceae bacterium]